MKRAALLAVAVLAMHAVGRHLLAESQSSADSVEELIARLEAAEKLYENHDVRFRIDMRLDESRISRFKTPPGTDPQGSVVVFAESHREGHFVSQEAMFRLDQRGTALTVNGDLMERAYELIDAFDGATLRRLSRNAVANISQTRREPRERFSPHSLILSHADLCVPLSLLLRGTQAVKASPFADRLPTNAELTNRLAGIETAAGLTLQKLVIGVRKEGAEIFRFEFWLTQERNLIPSRMLQYGRDSATVPSAIAEVRRWLEVQPGEWFPVEIAATVFDGDALRSSGVQNIAWTQTTSLDQVDLEPNYPTEFFSDVTIPEGVKVHHLDSAGRIVSQSMQDSPILNPTDAPIESSSTVSPKSRSSWTLLGVAVLFVAVILATIRFLNGVSRKGV